MNWLLSLIILAFYPYGSISSSVNRPLFLKATSPGCRVQIFVLVRRRVSSFELKLMEFSDQFEVDINNLIVPSDLEFSDRFFTSFPVDPDVFLIQ
jgi:hypothetical protein